MADTDIASMGVANEGIAVEGVVGFSVATGIAIMSIVCFGAGMAGLEVAAGMGKVVMGRTGWTSAS
jgi:hypothetical protein